jgi:hypothetical protein
MIIRTATQRPIIFPVAIRDGQVVNAGETPTHKALLVKLPVFIAIGTKLIA